jgi:N-acetylmuramoyl-L-alanine amidase
MMATHIPAHPSNYTAGREAEIDRIVIHYTAGDGDSAEDNGNYFKGANRKASAHYFVDEDSIVMSVKEEDTAWHAGNWEMNCRSIGVEMCSYKDVDGNYYIAKDTIENAVQLTRRLMKKHDIPAPGVVRHYDVTAKKCPEPFVRNEALWQDFKKRIAAQTESDAPADWAKDAWAAAKSCAVMDGTRPLDGVTRQELAVILHRLGLVR